MEGGGVEGGGMEVEDGGMEVEGVASWPAHFTSSLVVYPEQGGGAGLKQQGWSRVEVLYTYRHIERPPPDQRSSCIRVEQLCVSYRRRPSSTLL